MRLQGKVVMITGAGSGLGRECASLFTEEGAKVMITDLSPKRTEDAVAWVRGQGGMVEGRTADVRDEVQVAAAIRETVNTFGRLDILFNNAGIAQPGIGKVRFEDMTTEDWRNVIDTNLTGMFYGCKHAVPFMREQGGGVILCTSSVASITAVPGFVGYNASKAGVNGLVRSLSFDLGRYNIRINALLPSHGMSPNFLMDLDSEVAGMSYDEQRQANGEWDHVTAPYPLKSPEPPRLRDNAYAALFLVSDESKWMTGVTLPSADGGNLYRSSLPFEDSWLEDLGAATSSAWNT